MKFALIRDAKGVVQLQVDSLPPVPFADLTCQDMNETIFSLSMHPEDLRDHARKLARAAEKTIAVAQMLTGIADQLEKK